MNFDNIVATTFDESKLSKANVFSEPTFIQLINAHIRQTDRQEGEGGEGGKGERERERCMLD